MGKVYKKFVGQEYILMDITSGCVTGCCYSADSAVVDVVRLAD